MEMNFKDWLLNQNYTRLDFEQLDQQHQLELITAYLMGDSYE